MARCIGREWGLTARVLSILEFCGGWSWDVAISLFLVPCLLSLLVVGNELLPIVFRIASVVRSPDVSSVATRRGGKKNLLELAWSLLIMTELHGIFSLALRRGTEIAAKPKHAVQAAIGVYDNLVHTRLGVINDSVTLIQ